MDKINLYEVDEQYINYLSPKAPHLFHNKKEKQQNSRKYIGVVLVVNGMNYFAPLSSYKDKHRRMDERMDFIKIKQYAVINLNNMFPVPDGVYSYVDISKEKDAKYKSLLLSEYRYIRSIQDKIFKKAKLLYSHKLCNGDRTALARRCNDFRLLEDACMKYDSRNRLNVRKNFVVQSTLSDRIARKQKIVDQREAGRRDIKEERPAARSQKPTL